MQYHYCAYFDMIMCFPTTITITFPIPTMIITIMILTIAVVILLFYYFDVCLNLVKYIHTCIFVLMKTVLVTVHTCMSTSS